MPNLHNSLFLLKEERNSIANVYETIKDKKACNMQAFIFYVERQQFTLVNLVFPNRNLFWHLLFSKEKQTQAQEHQNL